MTDDIQSMPNPFVPSAVDLYMWVGSEKYTVRSFTHEAEQWGISKRIPITSIPEGVVPGVSRLFLAHKNAVPMVTAEGKTLKDLVARLVELGELDEDFVLEHTSLQETWRPDQLELMPFDYLPEDILTVTIALDGVENEQRHELIKEFDVKYHAGVFGYAYLTGVQMVLPKDQDELPDNLKHLSGYLEPVHVEYIDENGESIDSETVVEEGE